MQNADAPIPIDSAAFMYTYSLSQHPRGRTKTAIIVCKFGDRLGAMKEIINNITSKDTKHHIFRFKDNVSDCVP